MLDIRFVRENPEIVKENIKKKFQDSKLPLVDEVLDLDAKNRAAITEASDLRASRNTLSKQIGMLMGQAKKNPSKAEEAEKIKEQVKKNADRLAERIVQLGGEPDFNPDSLTERAHAQYTEGNGLRDMVFENLVAERIAIDSYREIVQYIGDKDPTTRRIFEDILAQEEEHADDLAGLLDGMN